MKVDDAGASISALDRRGRCSCTIPRATAAGQGGLGTAQQLPERCEHRPDGSAYATDSNVPAIYRVTVSSGGEVSMERWVDVSPTISYTSGFNLGGIDVSDDGRYIIVAQANVGKLYRVEVATKAISEVQLDSSQSLTGTDGIWLDGTTLYAMRNSVRLLVTINMADDLGSGTVASSTTDPSFAVPDHLRQAGDRLLVVNSQFDKRAGTPDLPFNVSVVLAPRAGTAQQTPTAAPAPATPAATPQPAATEAAPTPGIPTEPLPPVVQPTTAPSPACPPPAPVKAPMLSVLALLASMGLARGACLTPGSSARRSSGTISTSP